MSLIATILLHRLSAKDDDILIVAASASWEAHIVNGGKWLEALGPDGSTDQQSARGARWVDEEGDDEALRNKDHFGRRHRRFSEKSPACRKRSCAR